MTMSELERCLQDPRCFQKQGKVVPSVPATDDLPLAGDHVAPDEMVCTQITTLPTASCTADQTIPVHYTNVLALGNHP